MDPLARPALRLIADRFKLLASPTRLEILQYICGEERTVGELVSVTGFSQANVSQHLSRLDSGGMVRRRTSGNYVYYTVADDSLPELCRIIQQQIRDRDHEIREALGSE